VGMKICTTTMEISMDGPQETKARATIWYCTLGHTAEGM
jgi:hypothetical protein